MHASISPLCVSLPAGSLQLQSHPFAFGCSCKQLKTKRTNPEVRLDRDLCPSQMTVNSELNSPELVEGKSFWLPLSVVREGGAILRAPARRNQRRQGSPAQESKPCLPSAEVARNSFFIIPTSGLACPEKKNKCGFVLSNITALPRAKECFSLRPPRRLCPPRSEIVRCVLSHSFPC